MTRTRTLEAVSAVERRLRAAAQAAAALAAEAAGRRQRHRAEFARALARFNACEARTAFACAVADAHRISLAASGIEISDSLQSAERASREASAAVLPWAQIRCGLARRRSRLTEGQPI